MAQSHVTVLPPRTLSVDVEVAESELRSSLPDYPPFEVALPRLRVFRETSVVFADVSDGRAELLAMHRDLNTGPLWYPEPHEYHPHVTLAQGLPPELLDEVYEWAQRKWYESAPTDSFLVDTLTFVQNTVGNRWLDLSEHALRGAMTVPSR
jgi:2'-5' RNA ligase